MNIQPLADRVVIRPVEPDSVTKSGIYIPETANKERPHMYEVVAVGPGKEIDGKIISIDLTVGDKVLKGQYSGDEIKMDGETLHIVAEEYILAKIAE